MPLSDITIVVTSHNPGTVLDRTLSTVLMRAPTCPILLVDSGSTDGTAARIHREFASVTVHEFEENRGPCATRNYGLEHAETPFVLFLDDDTVFEQGALHRLLQELESDDAIAMVGPRIVHADNPDVVQYEGGLCHFGGAPHMLNMGRSVPPGPPRDVDVLTSGCLLVRKDPACEIGGFDENLFFLMEDVEFSLRMRYRGARLRVVPEAIARNEGGSEGLSLKANKRYPKRRVFYHSRNRWLVLRSLLAARSLMVLALPLLVLESAWFVFSILQGAFGSYLAGKRDYFRRSRRAVERRVSLDGHRALTDRQLLRAPPLTLTPRALSNPILAAFASALDWVLRGLFFLLKGLLP